MDLMNCDILIFFLFGVIFIILFLLSYSNFVKKLLSGEKTYRFLLFLILLFQITAIALTKFEVGDVFLFSKAGHYLGEKLDFYEFDSAHSQYPFFPFLMYFYSIFHLLAGSFNFFTFSFFLKLFLLLPCLWGLSFLVKSAGNNEIEKRLSQIQFLTSPIVYFVILFHGQTDVVLLFLFFASAIVSLPVLKTKNTLIGAIFFGLSILAKTWSVIFIPMYLLFQKNLKKSLLFFLTVILILIADIFIYFKSVYYTKLDNIIPAISKPGGPSGVWGLSFFFSPFINAVEFITKNNLVIFAILLSIIYFLVWKTKRNFWESCFLLILGIYLIIPNWGVQYLFWILPFIFIIKPGLSPKLVQTFTFLATAYLLASYTNIIFNRQAINLSYIYSLGIILWLFIFYWFVFEIFQKKRVIKS